MNIMEYKVGDKVAVAVHAPLAEKKKIQDTYDNSKGYFTVKQINSNYTMSFEEVKEGKTAFLIHMSFITHATMPQVIKENNAQTLDKIPSYATNQDDTNIRQYSSAMTYAVMGLLLLIFPIISLVLSIISEIKSRETNNYNALSISKVVSILSIIQLVIYVLSFIVMLFWVIALTAVA